VDFLSAGGHKWLLGPIGTGVFYCRRDAMDRLHPPVVGYHSVDKGEDHMDYDLTFRETAGRFEEALVNFPGIWGLAAAVEDILALGAGRIEAHITGLIDIAVEGLAARGYGIVSSLAAGERSGILTFRHGTIPPGEICRRLAAANIHLSVRGEGVRMSPGVYNDEEEIRCFLEALP
jgi:selenocysteine lyase/cysteine desulfurase